MTASPPRRLGLLTQLVLLWRLRVTLARGGLPQGTALVPAALGFAALAGSAGATAVGMHALLGSAPVAADPTLGLFLLLLTGFLASTMWIVWPVVTAGVDDAAELSRFALFPVSSGRLFFASVVAGLFEPRTLPLWGALFGAGLAVQETRGGHLVALCAATVLLAFTGVVWGRVGLHLVLNVLQNRRSAEAMGAGLLVMLGLSALVPPPDLSWLRDVSGGLAAVDGHLVAGALFLFTALPTGAWAWLVVADASGRPLVGLLFGSYLVCTATVGYVLALVLLERFHRRAGRALPQAVAPVEHRRAFRGGTLFLVVAERELRDALQNPRVRLMLALPFFLAILLKLVGARALSTALAGEQADAWLVGGLASYGSLVLAAGLAQNAFGYDGGGATLLLGAPVDPRTILRAKNAVTGGLALAASAAIVAFAALYLGRPALWVLLLVAPNTLFQVLVLLAVGNVLSVVAPRRFHPSLKRRDKASPVAMAAGLAAASLAVLPGSLLLRLCAPVAPSPALVALFWGLPVGAALAWRWSLEVALRLLRTRRSELLRAVTRQ